MTDIVHNSLLETNLRSLETRGLVSKWSAGVLRSVKPSHLTVSEETGWLYENHATGVRVTLQSKRDPEGEAKRQVQAWLSSNGGRASGLIAVVGAAGLQHVKTLAQQVAKGSVIIVLEPEAEILAAALARMAIEELEQPGVELRFSAPNDIPILLEEFRFALRKLERLETGVLTHPPSARTDTELYSRINAGLAEKLRLEFINRETLARFSREWLLNSIANLPALLDSTPVGALAGALEGCSAIVVGAGPSLDEALETIGRLRESFAIIAAGTALKPLLAAGIQPDFTVGVDSDAKTLLQFKGLPLERTHLACALNTHPALPRLFPAGKRAFLSANLSPGLNAWLEINKLLPDRLSAGGTVAVTAIDLARLLGCGKVVLCGVDLAMSPEGLTHATGSIYAGRTESELLPVEGNQRAKVMTNRQFANYISMTGSFLFDLRKRWGVETFNASTTGARIANAQAIALEGLAELAGRPPLAGRGEIDSILAEARPKGHADAAKLIEETAHELELIAKEPSRLEAMTGNSKLLLDAMLEAASRAEKGYSCSDGEWLFSKIPSTASQVGSALRKALEEIHG